MRLASLCSLQTDVACAQEYPPLPKQPPWPSEPQPPAVDWDALIAEVVERGKDVPEVDWAIPGEDAAEEVRHDQSGWEKECVQRTRSRGSS